MEKTYHYTECGLENVYIVSGFRRIESHRGAGIVIDDIPGLHRAIGLHLAHERKRLDGREVRFLRHEMGHTQARLASLLGVNEQAVARWEKGQSEIHGAADKVIRVLYLEHIGEEERVTDITMALAELDEQEPEDTVFEEADGWRLAEAA